MRLGRTLGVDVPDIDSICNVVVADQHAVALEPHALGAHDGSRGLFREVEHIRRALLKLWGEHVVGIIAEGIVAQSCIRRLGENLFPAPAESLLPNITDPNLW